MDDAREQIARRLCKISITGHRARTDDTPFENSFGQTKKRYRMLADEVIRQMRYAFSRWPEDSYPNSGSESAAPDDWTPERKD